MTCKIDSAAGVIIISPAQKVGSAHNRNYNLITRFENVGALIHATAKQLSASFSKISLATPG